jgi:hypothetical protein
MASRLLIALLLAATVAGFPAVAHAQEGMRSPLSGNSLDVLVEPQWSDDGQASFKVSFLKHDTDTVQIHIDYGFVIKQGDQVVFNAALPGQPLLHTASGVVTIPQSDQPPIKFPANGDYTIEISVAGINFTPMNTETATFNTTVTPEFPVGAVGVVAAFMTTAAIVLARYRKPL